MKSKDIRSMDKTAFNEKLLELKKELVKMNAQVAIGSAIKNPGQISKVKKTIAKIYTIQKERGMGLEKDRIPNKKPEDENAKSHKKQIKQEVG